MFSCIISNISSSANCKVIQSGYLRYGVSNQILCLFFHKHTPSEFWQNRKVITDNMEAELMVQMLEQGHCNVTGFQILRVDFAQSYEDMITAYQLKVQAFKTKENEKV